jgi:2-polyprenyl-3-methyl-5-hydroxy-6-metoxy-1,4-benzoquinol methylase
MSDNRFDRKAADWDKKRMRRELAETVSRELSRLFPDNAMLALDFGCGTGLVSIPLASKAGKIIALDSSSGMVEVLEEKLSSQKIINIQPMCAEIGEADLPANFDIIFTSMAMHHIADIKPVLQRFSELLKPGGIVAIADLDIEDGSFHKPGSGEKHHGFDRAALQEELNRFDFSKISFSTIYTINKTMQDGSTRDFTVFLATAEKI